MPADPADLREVPVEELAVWLTAIPPVRHYSSVAPATEAWSVFQAGGFQFVARTSISTQVRGGPHRTFTHARAWRISGSGPLSDFGALLGRAEAFASNPPSTVNVMSIADPTPGMIWEPLLREHADAAIRLTSQLYRARVAGRKVVITAEPEEFTPGHRLHELVAFARAALPAALKRAMSVRIYAQEPSQFSAAGISVVMTFDAEPAVHANQQALLLSSDGKPFDPRENCDLTYGKSLVKRSLELPHGFFAFTNRFSAQLPVRAASVVYNLTASRGNRCHLDELLEYYFTHPLPLPWQEILTAEEWSAFSDDILRKVAFAKPVSSDAAALQRHILAEFARRPKAFRAGLAQWWSGKFEDRGIRLLQMFGDELIPQNVATPLIAQLETEEIVRLLKTPRLLLFLANATETLGCPNTSWEKAFLEIDDPYTPLSEILNMAGDSSPWRGNAINVFNRIVAADKPVSSDAVSVIRKCLVGHSGEECLVIAEMLFRAVTDSVERGEQGIPASILTRVRNGRERRQLLEQKKEARWTCLRSFVVPLEWLAEVADLLPMNEIEHRDVSHVAKALPPGDIFPPPLMPLFDRWMKSQPDRTTLALVGGGHWLAWRSSSKLTANELEEAALAWLTANSSEHTLASWEQAIRDIGKITAAKVAVVISQKRWPWIAGSEDRQVQDMLARVENVVVYRSLCKLSERFLLEGLTVEIITNVVAGPIQGDASMQAILKSELDKRVRSMSPPLAG